MLNRDTRLERYALLLLYLIVVIRNAWISDDAYITFRTIENFLSGYGITYNPYVRVQVYTHPAWMFLLSSIYFIERLFIPYAPNALYFIDVFVSIFISFLAMVFVIKAVARDDLPTTLLAFSALTLSRAFIDYSTSGLENPLSHLLLVIFIWVYIRTPEKIYLLTFISSLLLLNRQDLVLLILPAILYTIWVNWKRMQTIKELILGAVPFLAWELFSIFYYGFPFPNTAYAKLNTGVDGLLLAQQGIDYLLNSIHWDPLTLFIIIVAGVSLLISTKQHDRDRLLLYIGVGLYILYVVKIGGDFMSGRFLTAPFLVSIIVLARASLPGRNLFLITGIIMLFGIFSVRSTLLEPKFPAFLTYDLAWDGNEITDERSIYFANADEGIYLGFIENGLRNADVGSKYAGQNWYFTGTRKVSIETAIGLFGYAKGPNIYVIDREALTDPLLARLPTHQKQWRIGHFGRDFPNGYLETLETGINHVEDPNISTYYEQLDTVIHGSLWDWKRIETIWKLNTGQYDHLIANYVEILKK